MFHKKVRTTAMMEKIRGFTPFFAAFEPHTPANFIVRLKQDQSMIRKLLLRIDTIRDTSFIASGYRIAEINSMLLIIGMIFLKLEPFTNTFFFTFVISLLFLYMLSLIKDLDNPYGFYEQGKAENVHVKVLEDTTHELEAIVKEL